MSIKTWFAGREIVRLPSSVKTVPDASTKALEDAWRRRRQELGAWHPSGGWLIERGESRAHASN
jgi:hypothetical protein